MQITPRTTVSNLPLASGTNTFNVSCEFAPAVPQETLGSGQASDASGLMKPVKFEKSPAADRPSHALAECASGIPSSQTKVGNGPVDAGNQQRLLEALTSKGKPIPNFTYFVVFGALSDNMLNRTPGRSLAHMAETGELDPAKGQRIVLVDYKAVSNQEYLARFEKGDPGQSVPLSEKAVANFAKLTGLDGPDPAIQVVNVKSLGDFQKLKGGLNAAQNVVPFLTLPPSLAIPTITNLADSGIGRDPGQKLEVAAEKPFGTDLKSAHELADVINAKLPGKVFNIDHFNGYSGTMNALLYRLDPAVAGVMNKDHVDSVAINTLEQVKSNDRAAFIEMGIVKDMLSHNLQMGATILSNYPSADQLTGEGVTQAKDDFIRSVQVNPEGIHRGQFTGFNDPATGFPANHAPSDAETAATFQAKMNTEQWAGVPLNFNIMKAWNDDSKEPARFGVDVHLKQLTPAMADKLGVPLDTKGTLSFDIKPAKVYFTSDAGQKVELPFQEAAGSEQPYEPLFRSAANGNSGPFVSAESAVGAWNSIETVRNNWGDAGAIVHYPIGSSVADFKNLEALGRAWAQFSGPGLVSQGDQGDKVLVIPLSPDDPLRNKNL